MWNGPSRAVAWLLVLLSTVTVAAAQEQAETDSDPTRPVFLSLRPEFYRISEDVDRFSLIARYDRGLFREKGFLGARSGLILRFELPVFSHADTASDSASGLGDAYGQFLLVPHASRKFLWIAGSGFLLPTATDPLLGAGKWVAAPLVVPLWRLPRGLFLVKVQNFTSFAGDSDRRDINHLLITPIYIRTVGRNFWILLDTETKTNWEDDGRTGVKSGLQFGRRAGRAYGFWIKPEVWWGPNRDGDWNLKIGLLWYQRRR
jgi:hypothetical protein